MKFLLVILFSYCFKAHASLPELFAPSAGSMSIGGQAQKQSAANNYHAASLLGYSKTTQFSFDVFYINTNFKEINNVVVKNETNTVNTFEKGDVKVNSTPTAMFGAHLSTPLFSPEGLKFNISIFAPFDRLMESDTGDPYIPSYVMYQNRFLRPTLLFSGAQSFGDWSFSVGAQTGFQSSGETYIITRATTSGSPSLAKISFNAKPSLGAVFSIAKRSDHQQTYFSIHQEMKSKLQNRATGETEVANASFGQFDFDISSLLYYDPMTIKLGHQIHQESSSLYFGLEFQQWDNFENSTLKIKKRGGTINGSNNFEHLKLKNIFIPRLGFEKNISSNLIGKIGYFYRQSPLYTNNLKNAGNSIDVDKHVASVGLAKLLNFYQKVLTLDVAYQAHILRNTKITKTPNRENGAPDHPKIGSPGYQVGGMIHVLSLGISWMY
jgi:hypothetical protein